MPGYAALSVAPERLWDVSAKVLLLTSNLFADILMNQEQEGWSLFYYFLLGVGVYVFAFEKLKNKIAALVAALGVMHSTFIVILIMVGHLTKVPVIAFFPFILLILERLREKFRVVDLLVLILLIHFMLLPVHVQMIFYSLFCDWDLLSLFPDSLVCKERELARSDSLGSDFSCRNRTCICNDRR